MFPNSRVDEVAFLVVAFGVILVVVGFAWIRSITRAEDDEPSSWRYQSIRLNEDELERFLTRHSFVKQAPPEPKDPTAQINDEFAKSWRRARRGRRVARLTFAMTIILVALLSLLVFFPPNYMYDPEPSLMGAVVPSIGIIGLAIGVAWMWRILRADRERDARAWRYRDF